MDGKAFKTAVDALVKEKGINEDIIYEAMELALTSAYKKNYHSLSNVRVDINRDNGEIHIYSFKTVVFDEEWEKEEGKYEIEIFTDEDGTEYEEEVEFIYDDRIHITLEDAKKIVPSIKITKSIGSCVSRHGIKYSYPFLPSFPGLISFDVSVLLFNPSSIISNSFPNNSARILVHLSPIPYLLWSLPEIYPHVFESP
mgnify:CR=1 FL=1